MLQTNSIWNTLFIHLSNVRSDTLLSSAVLSFCHCICPASQLSHCTVYSANCGRFNMCLTFFFLNNFLKETIRQAPVFHTGTSITLTMNLFQQWLSQSMCHYSPFVQCINMSLSLSKTGFSLHLREWHLDELLTCTFRCGQTACCTNFKHILAFRPLKHWKCPL